MSFTMMKLGSSCLFWSVFLRKSFSIDKDLYQLLVLFWSTNTSNAQLALALNTGIISLWIKNSYWSPGHLRYGLPGLDFQDVINFTVLSLAKSWINTVHDPMELWTCLIITSVFQLLRNPSLVKSFLRPVRLCMAPVYLQLAVNAMILQVCRMQ